MSKYTGLNFIDNKLNNREVVQYDEEKQWYYVTRGNIGGYELLTERDIEFHLNKQDKYQSIIVKRKEEEEQARLAAEAEYKRFKNLNLFLDTKSPMQAGKARTHLVDKEILYKRFYSNFEFVEYMLSLGRLPKQKTYSHNNKTTWGFNNDHNAHIDISKTQYDYAKFLIDNELI